MSLAVGHPETGEFYQFIVHATATFGVLGLAPTQDGPWFIGCSAVLSVIDWPISSISMSKIDAIPSKTKFQPLSNQKDCQTQLASRYFIGFYFSRIT